MYSATVRPDICFVFAIATYFMTKPDLNDEGSTKCHIDRSGATNIMLYGDTTNIDTCAAEWFLFPESCIPFIYQVLRKGGLVTECHPGSEAQYLLQQNFFMDADMRHEVMQLSGKSYWRIEQCPGDAVFIPPRCPHQVGPYQVDIPLSNFTVNIRSPIKRRVTKSPPTLFHPVMWMSCGELRTTSA